MVPEDTLLNMVLKRMHRPRCCSYQLVFEHRRPSCIQGLRWVSTGHLPGWVRAGRGWIVVLAGHAGFSEQIHLGGEKAGKFGGSVYGWSHNEPVCPVCTASCAAPFSHRWVSRKGLYPLSITCVLGMGLHV